MLYNGILFFKFQCKAFLSNLANYLPNIVFLLGFQRYALFPRWEVVSKGAENKFLTNQLNFSTELSFLYPRKKINVSI